ncbi:HIT domain-containing protein [Candidatus Odyssella thessalonicensis]|uniref:HIT domain-containing protein n=1 Tax=Candidatus Odyssella thessalonicensis TaxID=84647 RepID=UPI000225B203|nr:HIT family protein [Candidatus Odyssella thessalonicensis]
MQLDSRLEQSSEFIANLKLCQLRLSKNAAFPWCILIPQRDNIIEIIDLPLQEQQLLMEEMTFMSQVMRDIFKPDKINIAALGNVVPQLHIHIIARYTTDPAWPNPVWNTVHSDYTEEGLSARINTIHKGILSSR